MHPLTVYNKQLENFIRTDFELSLLDSDCSFSEGPVWNKEGFYLFSDIPANVICKISPGSAKEVYLKNSGCTHPAEAELPRMMGSNGLAYDAEKHLLICQHGNHGIAKWDGISLQPLISSYQTKPLNSPNDIIVHPEGWVFFSDPPYGLRDQVINNEKYQPLAGFYCWRNGNLQLFCTDYQYPNGVCLSADGRSLFTCSNKPAEAFVLEFDTATLIKKRTVCRENSDGIKCDAHGNLYLCSKEGIIIISNEGERLGLIQLPTVPANMCWGGKEGRDVLITARENIFYIEGLLK